MKYSGVNNEMKEAFSKPIKAHSKVASACEVLQITIVFPGSLN